MTRTVQDSGTLDPLATLFRTGKMASNAEHQATAVAMIMGPPVPPASAALHDAVHDLSPGSSPVFFNLVREQPQSPSLHHLSLPRPLPPIAMRIPAVTKLGH